MTLEAEIQKHETIKTDDGENLTRLEVIDKCKPGNMRTGGHFVWFVGENVRKELPQGDLTDHRCKLQILSVKASQAGAIQIRASVIPK